MQNFDPFEVAIDEAERLLEQAGEARGDAERADELRKQREALMFIKHKDAGCSAAEAEKRAKADPEYRQAADEWMSANITWRRLEGKAKGKELRFEAWRTKQSTERAKMNLR